MAAKNVSRINGLAAAQLYVRSPEQTIKSVSSRLKLRFSLILFLVATFFLLCPLWAYLSLCGMDAHHNAGQSCFLYSFVFNMPVSLPNPIVLLVMLGSFGFIVVCRPPPAFRTSLYRILARAPPLS
jgi:hypothetical protein